MATLRLGNASRCLAHFGNLLYRETASSQEKQDTAELLSGKYHLRKPPKHGWHGSTTMAAMVFAVRGLREVVNALLHSSVWNENEIEQMLRQSEALYRINSGQIV